jgi:membrane protein implicated in regulation of membrane protease activity
VLSSFEEGGDGDVDASDSETDVNDTSGDDDGEHYDSDGSNLVDYHKYKARGLLQFIAFLRTLVYFCAGFGVTGIFALLTGESTLSSLLWSAFVGLGTVGIYKVFRKIQRNKLDSSFSDRELLNMKGEALLPMSGDSMGKVRIHFGSITVERYAKSASKETSIKKGEAIVISNVDSDVVYVRNLN